MKIISFFSISSFLIFIIASVFILLMKTQANMCTGVGDSVLCYSTFLQGAMLAAYTNIVALFSLLQSAKNGLGDQATSAAIMFGGIFIYDALVLLGLKDGLNLMMKNKQRGE